MKTDNNDFSVNLILEDINTDNNMNEWLLNEWANKHCIPKCNIDSNAVQEYEDAIEVILSKLCGFEITNDPIIFDLRDFRFKSSFAKALSLVSSRFKNNDEIIVRYVKKEDKEHNVYIQFHVSREEK